jgi:hypothetical protein
MDTQSPIWIERFVEFLNALRELDRDSDRGSAILGAAILDVALERVLSQVFQSPVSGGDDGLFSPERPLGSFAAKIDLSARLGLLSRDFAAALHLVRRIRNDAAHEHESFALDRPPSRDRVVTLARLYQRHADILGIGATFLEHPPGLSKDFRAVLLLLVFRLQSLLDRVLQTNAKLIVPEALPGTDLPLALWRP